MCLVVIVTAGLFTRDTAPYPVFTTGTLQIETPQDSYTVSHTSTISNDTARDVFIEKVRAELRANPPRAQEVVFVEDELHTAPSGEGDAPSVLQAEAMSLPQPLLYTPPEASSSTQSGTSSLSTASSSPQSTSEI